MISFRNQSGLKINLLESRAFFCTNNQSENTMGKMSFIRAAKEYQILKESLTMFLALI